MPGLFWPANCTPRRSGRTTRCKGILDVLAHLSEVPDLFDFVSIDVEGAEARGRPSRIHMCALALQRVCGMRAWAG